MEIYLKSEKRLVQIIYLKQSALLATLETSMGLGTSFLKLSIWNKLFPPHEKVP